MAVTTTQLCVKLDHHTLIALNKEAEVSGVKRNRIINIACDYYISHLDEVRREKALSNLHI